MATLRGALDKADFYHAAAGARAVAKLYESGGLSSPRLAIAHELEGDLLEIAQQQVQRAEKTPESDTRRVHLGIAAFLAGAALEDCLRRLSDANSLAYDTRSTSLAKPQSALYQPNANVAVISASANKQITSWAATRNIADHGKRTELTQAEVVAMVIGVRGFLDKHMP